VLKFAPGNNLRVSADLVIRSSEKYDWERKNMLFYILSLVTYCVTILRYFSSVIVMLFCGGLVVVRTY